MNGGTALCSTYTQTNLSSAPSKHKVYQQYVINSADLFYNLKNKIKTRVSFSEAIWFPKATFAHCEVKESFPEIVMGGNSGKTLLFQNKPLHALST